MQPGQHRGLGAAQIVAERQRVGTTTQTAVHHLDLARGGGGGSRHWSGHATKITPQSRLRKLGCVICLARSIREQRRQPISVQLTQRSSVTRHRSGCERRQVQTPQGDPARTFSKIFGNLRTEAGRTAALGLLCVAGKYSLRSLFGEEGTRVRRCAWAAGRDDDSPLPRAPRPSAGLGIALRRGGQIEVDGDGVLATGGQLDPPEADQLRHGVVASRIAYTWATVEPARCPVLRTRTVATASPSATRWLRSSMSKVVYPSPKPNG